MEAKERKLSCRPKRTEAHKVLGHKVAPKESDQIIEARTGADEWLVRSWCRKIICGGGSIPIQVLVPRYEDNAESRVLF